MTRRLGVVMDPISTITVKKDTTLAMLLAAQARGWEIHYFEQPDLYLLQGEAWGHSRILSVQDDPQHWYQFHQAQDLPLASLDAILMRKDPPFNMDYIYTTYILERAEAQGTLIVNRPQALRDANEKLFTAWFPQCLPPTLVTASSARIRQFLDEHGDIVVKPPDGMGGTSIFRLDRQDPNIGVVLETLTGHNQHLAMAQRYIPEIVDGDKRILLINGEPIPYALARLAAKGETRANLAAGGRGVGVALSERDRWLCNQVAPTLREKGLVFVGLDVIGDYITEINVTSPTCIRELDAAFGLDIGGQFMEAVAAKCR